MEAPKFVLAAAMGCGKLRRAVGTSQRNTVL